VPDVPAEPDEPDEPDALAEPDELAELPDDAGGGTGDELLESGFVSGSELQPATASSSALII